MAKAEGKAKRPSTEKEAGKRDPKAKRDYAKAGRQRLLNALLDPNNMDVPVAKICKAARVSRQTYYRYHDNEEFLNELRKKAKGLVAPHVGRIINKMVDQALLGDTKAAKLVLEIDETYVKRLQVEGNPDKPVSLDIPALKDLTVEVLQRLAERA